MCGSKCELDGCNTKLGATSGRSSREGTLAWRKFAGHEANAPHITLQSEFIGGNRIPTYSALYEVKMSEAFAIF